MLNAQNIHGPGDAIMAVMMLLICLLCGSYPVIKLIGWWMDGGVEPLLACMGIMLYVVLLMSVTMLPFVLAIPIILVILASSIMMPYFGKVVEHADLRKIANEEMDRYGRALEENPMNHAARMGLAELLHKRGELDQSIEHMEWTLQQAPSLSFRIRPQLEGWKRERERIGVAQPVFCHRCRCENHPMATECMECGAAFGVKAGMKQQMWREGGPQVVVRAWITTALTVLLGCFAFLFLPAILAAPILLATIIVGAWLFLRWVGGDMGTVGD